MIDLSEVAYIDSAALGMLLVLRERSGSDQSQIKLTGAKDQTLKVLEVADFGRLFEID